MTSVSATVGASPGTAGFTSPRPVRDPPDWLVALAATRQAYPDTPITIEVRADERPIIEKVRLALVEEQDAFYARLHERMAAIATGRADCRSVEDPSTLKVDSELLDVVLLGVVRQTAEATTERILAQALAGYGISLVADVPP